MSVPQLQGDLGETELRDGLTLGHIEAGTGAHLVMLPGWSQTAELFETQIETLSSSSHVLALDHRGHGRSDDPPTGYHLHRLAADVHDLLAARDMSEVTLMGHSMGCAVIWSYLELFGDHRLSSLVLVDQMPCAMRNPQWTDQEAADAGATMDFEGLYGFTNSLRAAGSDPRVDFLRTVTSDGISDEQLAWLIEQNLLMEREQAADLIHDVATHDWRALIATIDLPTLVVAGNSPNVPLRSQQWIAEQIPNARFAMVEGASGGTHFPFVESPEQFNEVVAEFLSR